MHQAVQFLHELGSVQHFSNEALKSKVVINPQWIVDAMACVVSVHDTPIQVTTIFSTIICLTSYRPTVMEDYHILQFYMGIFFIGVNFNSQIVCLTIQGIQSKR